MTSRFKPLRAHLQEHTVLLAVEVPPDAIGALQAVAIAIVAGYVALRTRKIDAVQKKAAARYRRERERCDKLEQRVDELERRRDARIERARRRRMPEPESTGQGGE